jgi:hypothetical protein
LTRRSSLPPERLDIGAIATLDRRHFGVVRPGHRSAFEFLP